MSWGNGSGPWWARNWAGNLAPSLEQRSGGGLRHSRFPSFAENKEIEESDEGPVRIIDIKLPSERLEEARAAEKKKEA